MDGCAGTPEQGRASLTGLGGQGPLPLPLGGLSHPHLGAEPVSQALPVPLLAAALGLRWPSQCHLDGRAWKSAPGTTPTLVWPGSRSPGAHVIGVGASSFLSLLEQRKWDGLGMVFPGSAHSSSDS